MLKLGTNNIDKIYLGDTKIAKAYLGDTLVYKGGNNVDYTKEYLTIKGLGSGNITITIPTYVTGTYITNISWSKDKEVWNNIIVDNTEQIITIPISLNEKIYIKGVGNATGTTNNNSRNTTINATCNIEVFGNIMSLLYEDNFENQTSLSSVYAFASLFSSNTHLIKANNLILPATTLSNNCYRCMFQYCSELRKPPTILPATILTMGCYQQMFEGCSTLEIPTTISATSTQSSCCSMMFKDCVNLTSAPELLASTLTSSCYLSMFKGCTSLRYIKMLGVTVASLSLTTWVVGVAVDGIFIKHPNASLPSGTSGIPEGWTVQTATE